MEINTLVVFWRTWAGISHPRPWRPKTYLHIGRREVFIFEPWGRRITALSFEYPGRIELPLPVLQTGS